MSTMNPTIKPTINLSVFSLKKPLICCLFLRYIFGYIKLDKPEIETKNERKMIIQSNQEA